MPRWPERTFAQRFWDKVNKAGPVHPTLGTECWLWTACRVKTGYGRFGISKSTTHLAHRVAYSIAVGPIPDGLTIDHLCRNHSCVNPAHLEPVTLRENTMRGVGFAPKNAAKTACPKGHAYTPENTMNRNGMRFCRACGRDACRAWREKRKAGA